MQNRREQNFYFKIALGSLAGGIIARKVETSEFKHGKIRKKDIFAEDVHVLGSQNATAGMQQP